MGRLHARRGKAPARRRVGAFVPGEGLPGPRLQAHGQVLGRDRTVRFVAAQALAWGTDRSGPQADRSGPQADRSGPQAALALGFRRKRLLAGGPPGPGRRPKTGRAEHAHRMVEAKRAHGVSEQALHLLPGLDTDRVTNESLRTLRNQTHRCPVAPPGRSDLSVPDQSNSGPNHENFGLEVEDILHGGDKVSIDLGNTPHVLAPGLEVVLRQASAHGLVRQALVLG